MNAVYFQGRHAAPFLLGQWRAQGAARAIPASMKVLDLAGFASREFRGLARAAFPTRRLPIGVIAHPDGRATSAFLDYLRG